MWLINWFAGITILKGMKKTEQVLRNGNIVVDYDQILTTKEIKKLLYELFNPEIKEDGKQYVLYDKIALLACNVTYLGNPHPIYKKRVQLKSYYLDYLSKNSANNLRTLYLGIYTYNQTRLFVVFEPSTYAAKKSHNSSAHVYSINLQYAQKAGKFSKVDAFGNQIHIFNTYEFVRYIKTLANDPIHIDSDELMKIINEYISSFKDTIKKEWKGVDCFKEMMGANDPNAKQGEWQGWYFEYLFKKYLAEHKTEKIEWYASKRKGDIDLDVKFTEFDWIFGDLKADQINHDILGNSFDCLDTVIKDNHGTVYYICCLYKAEKDSDHQYEVSRYWNDHVRDANKRYDSVDELKERYGKRMKYSVKPETLCVLKIDEIVYEILKKNPFAQGTNSDGKDRKPKLKVQKDMIKALSVYSQQIL